MQLPLTPPRRPGRAVLGSAREGDPSPGEPAGPADRAIDRSRRAAVRLFAGALLAAAAPALAQSEST
jgi:hypothetical protein